MLIKYTRYFDVLSFYCQIHDETVRAKSWQQIGVYLRGHDVRYKQRRQPIIHEDDQPFQVYLEESIHQKAQTADCFRMTNGANQMVIKEGIT